MSILNVNEYARTGNSDSAVISAALKKAGRGDTVRIPRYNARTGGNEWRITETLKIKDGVRLYLDNCRLVMESGTYCNMISAEKGTCDISVIGEGNALLSGGEWNYLSGNMSGKYGMPDVTANALLKFSGVKNLTVRNVRFEMPRWTCILLDHVEGADLKDIWFDMIPHVMNLTGIILGCGCRKIRTENLTGRSGEETILIFADSDRYQGKEGADISDIAIRNLVTDSNRSSMVHIRANGGLKVHDVELDTIMDSSDFFEKKRIRANLELGTGMAELDPAKMGDIFNIHMKTAFSSAFFTVAFDCPLKDSLIENIFTFGDNINIAKNTGGAASAENVTLRRLYYGMGSEPNNSNSFISRYAKGAKPVQLETVKGNLKVEKLFLQDEEETENE